MCIVCDRSYSVSQGSRPTGYSNGDPSDRSKRRRLDIPQSLAELSDEALRVRRQVRHDEFSVLKISDLT